jgi:hypothetical protein
MANTNTVQKIRNQAADADLRRAKRCGEHMVAQTSKGNVTIKYYPKNSGNGEFWSLWGANMETAESFSMACGVGRTGKAAVKAVLASLYIIQFA